MNALEINLAEGREAFQPGEDLNGTAYWQLERAPRSAELRLFWFTRGKGSEDAGIVETVRFEHPREGETRPFRFRLPDGPYSFSGKLISLIWALELVTESPDSVTRRELVLGPARREVRLETVPVPGKQKRWYDRLSGKTVSEPSQFKIRP
jgi:hypothetical protein